MADGAQGRRLGITPELGAIERATAANPRDLPREQANLALWISKNTASRRSRWRAGGRGLHDVGPGQASSTRP